jgi:hypothetical protein
VPRTHCIPGCHARKFPEGQLKHRTCLEVSSSESRNVGVPPRSHTIREKAAPADRVGTSMELTLRPVAWGAAKTKQDPRVDLEDNPPFSV